MGINKKIVNNTIYLYLRMLFLMCISFYTSRVVLEILGVEDFGIYNVVGGLVVLLSFLNNTLITSSQRFLSYEMGIKNGNIQKCFSSCLLIVFVISLIIVLVCETAGLWYVNNEMIIPDTKVEAAKLVFQISVLSVFFSTLRTPFVSLIISFENMSAYAVISILEAIFKLVFVFLLRYYSSNGECLILYAIFLCIISFLITTIYCCFCSLKYRKICLFTTKVDRYKTYEISNFAGWNILSILSDIGVPQGINLLMNGFGGVVLNAAMGIANQVTSAVYSLVSNFQMAFRPQVVKLYSAKQSNDLNELINTASKISFFLMLYLAIPFLVRTEDLMNIWLKEYPINAIAFSQLMILAFVIDSVCGPLWMTIQATGKIKIYQILTILLSLFFLLTSYYLLKIGFSPIAILYNRIMLSLMFFLLQLFYLRKIFKFSCVQYCANLFKNVLIGLVSFLLVYYFCNFFVFLRSIVATFFISTIIITLIVFVLVLNDQEKKHIHSRIKQLVFINK